MRTNVVVTVLVGTIVAACSSSGGQDGELLESTSAALDSSGSGSADARDPLNGGPVYHDTGIGFAGGGGTPGPLGTCFFTSITGPFKSASDLIEMGPGSDGNWRVWGNEASSPGPNYGWGCIKFSDFTSGGINSATVTETLSPSYHAQQYTPQVIIDGNTQAITDRFCSIASWSGMLEQSQPINGGGGSAEVFPDTVDNFWNLAVAVPYPDGACSLFTRTGCAATSTMTGYCATWTGGSSITFSNSNNAYNIPDIHGNTTVDLTPAATSFCLIAGIGGVMSSSSVGITIDAEVVSGTSTWVAHSYGGATGYVACVPFAQ